MKKNRLIVPSLHRLRKWAVSVFKDQDSTAAESPDVLERGVGIVFVGDGFSQKRDPEHLPPASVWQKFGNSIRVVSRFLSSPESMFGLRCACATMTVGIIGFLQDTQVFFQEQRLVWAMIIIAIGMTQSKLCRFYTVQCSFGARLTAISLRTVHLRLLLSSWWQSHRYDMRIYHLVHRGSADSRRHRLSLALFIHRFLLPD